MQPPLTQTSELVTVDQVEDIDRSAPFETAVPAACFSLIAGFNLVTKIVID